MSCRAQGKDQLDDAEHAIPVKVSKLATFCFAAMAG